jgi:hypothetical protein
MVHDVDLKELVLFVSISTRNALRILRERWGAPGKSIHKLIHSFSGALKKPYDRMVYGVLRKYVLTFCECRPG